MNVNFFIVTESPLFKVTVCRITVCFTFPRGGGGIINQSQLNGNACCIPTFFIQFDLRCPYHFGFGRVICQVKSSHCNWEMATLQQNIMKTQVEVRAWARALWRKDGFSGCRCWGEQGWWGDGVAWQNLNWMYLTQLLKEVERGMEMIDNCQI